MNPKTTSIPDHGIGFTIDLAAFQVVDAADAERGDAVDQLSTLASPLPTPGAPRGYLVEGLLELNSPSRSARSCLAVMERLRMLPLLALVLMVNGQAPADQSLCRDAQPRSLAAHSKFT
jgi:hypothetical protein